MACLVIAVALVLPGGAIASSSGEITRALVSSDWTTASIAASAVRSKGCVEPPEEKIGKEPPPGEEFPERPFETIITSGPEYAPWECGWIAFATLGPGTSADDCASPGRRWGSFEKGVRLVWESTELKDPGQAQFDLQNVALNDGYAAPLLCLAAVEAIPEGYCKERKFGFDCWYRILHKTDQLDSAQLEIVPASMAGEQARPLSPSGREPCRKLRKRQKRSQKQGGLALGSAIRVQGKPKRVRRCKTG